MAVSGMQITESHACNCVGPQRGEPRCPCLMRNIIVRDGCWIQPEVNLGPVIPARLAANYRFDFNK